MNQAIFERVNVDCDEGVASELSEFFGALLDHEVVAAARRHAQALRDDPECFERYRAMPENKGPMLVGAGQASGNEQTPDSYEYRGLKYAHLVGRTGLEPVTSTMSRWHSSQLS